MINSPLSRGVVCDEGILTRHTVEVVDRFSTDEVQLPTKDRQLSYLWRSFVKNNEGNYRRVC